MTGESSKVNVVTSFKKINMEYLEIDDITRY